MVYEESAVRRYGDKTFRQTSQGLRLDGLQFKTQGKNGRGWGWRGGRGPDFRVSYRSWIKYLDFIQVIWKFTGWL